MKHYIYHYQFIVIMFLFQIIIYSWIELNTIEIEIIPTYTQGVKQRYTCPQTYSEFHSFQISNR